MGAQSINTVTGLSSHETVLIPSFQTKIHNRLHLVLDLLQEILIPVGLIILVKTDDPEKTVIHDRVDMYLEGLFSAQSDQRPLLDLFIKKEIGSRKGSGRHLLTRPTGLF